MTSFTSFKIPISALKTRWVDSVEERQVFATLGLVFLVHEHTAPVVKHDGGVVRVTHGSTGKDAGISAVKAGQTCFVFGERIPPGSSPGWRW